MSYLHYVQSFGGKGANQIVQCSILGINSGFCGRLGNDDFGNEYERNFLSKDIDITNVKRSDISTGVACISVDDIGRNTIVIIPSANNLISPLDIQQASLDLENSKLLLVQNEIPRESTLEALKLAKSYDTITVFNPAPASTLTELHELIAYSDVICPNELELSTLTDLPTDTETQIEHAAKHLLTHTTPGTVVVVTLGERGAMIVRSSGAVLIPVPEAFKTQAVDTVGAGDCFIGTL